MTQAPDPRVFDAALRDVAEMLRHNPVEIDPQTRKPFKTYCGIKHPKTGQPVRLCLGCEYRYAYNAAHDRTVTDDAKVATSASSVVESVASSKAKLRGSCVLALEKLTGVMEGRKALRRAMSGTFAHHGVEAAATSKDQRLISDDEEDQSWAKKRDREAAGQGFGEG